MSDVTDDDRVAYSRPWVCGLEDPNLVAMKIEPTRVELYETFGSNNNRVWRAAPNAAAVHGGR